MNGTGWAVVILILVLIGGGAWWYTTQQPATQTNVTINQNATSTGAAPNETGSNTTGGADVTVDAGIGDSSAPMTATVTYTDQGFSPASVTIAEGGTVTFVNKTSRNMWVAADEHPSHAEYDGTTRATHCAANYTGTKPFDECANGSSYSFTFTKVGTFDYHNHSAAQYAGKVIVQ